MGGIPLPRYEAQQKQSWVEESLLKFNELADQMRAGIQYRDIAEAQLGEVYTSYHEVYQRQKKKNRKLTEDKRKDQELLTKITK